MNYKHSTRIKTGITVLVLCALFSGMRLLYQQVVSFSHNSMGRDFASVKVRRYKSLKGALPPYGVVGYLSDVRSRNMFDNNAPMAGYFAAQYTLAPVVIAHTADEEIVIGDFFHTRDIAKSYTKKGLVLLKDYGNGLLLLRRENK